MTETRWGRVPEGATSPHVSVVPTLRAASGSTLRVPVRVTNRASVERAVVVTAVGVDPAWLGVPARTLPLAPGAAEVVELELTPPQGTLPASYPLVVTGLAVDPVTGRTDAASSRPGQAESTLVVSPRSRLTIELEPPEVRAISSRKVTAVLRNSGGADAQVTLKVTHPRHGRVKFRRPQVVVPPDGEVRLTGRARLNRPRLLGYGARHAYRVTASTPESVRHAQGTLEQRAVFGPWGLKAVAILCVVAVWLGGAGFLVAKISQSQREKSQEDAAALADAEAGDDGGDAAGEDAGDEGSEEGGEDAAGEEGGEEAEGEEPAPPLQLAGTVVDQPGVTVRMTSTSLVDEEAQGATGIGVDTDDLDGDGKRPAAAFTVASPSQAPEARSTDTDADGAWALANVTSPGYYLLTFSKPGFQTERYVVDSSSELAKEPLEIEMKPGTGSLSGRVTGPGGAVGGATVVITDGTNTLTTSTTSDGSGAGRWSIDGLSAPGTYVVTATRRDMSSEARVVQLDSFGAATADLRLTAGVALVEGDVTAGAFDGTDHELGGATVTVTDGNELTRTATTLTVDPKGRFYLPALPVPGDYTVTIAATGYQTESISFSLDRGDASLVLDPTRLESVNGRVDGTMWGLARDAAAAKVARAAHRARTLPDGATPLAGVGLTLTNPDHSYKTTSSSITAVDGTKESGFAFDVVAPGVYTLTASFFNRITAERTVRVEAGDDGNPLELVLAELPDGPLPRTSRIVGEAVDVDTGKSIPTCTDGRLPTKAERDICLTATLVGTDFSDGFAADGGFLLPSDETCAAVPDGEQCGLRPGLYTVRIDAPGYVSRTVRVEVGENRRVIAPPVELTAVPSVSGTVSLRDPASGDGVTNPARSCVWLLSGTVSGAVLEPCTDAIGLGAAGDEAAEQNPDACLEARSVDRGQTGRTQWCAVTAADGTYTIEAPSTGPYTVVVEPANPEFVSAGDTALILDSGPEQVNVRLFRLGRVDLTVRQPPGGTDSQYTQLVPADDAVVRLEGSGTAAGVVKDVTLDDLRDGVQTVSGLLPGSYAITGTSADGVHNGRLAVALDVDYDSRPDAGFDLTDPVTDFLGRVVGYDFRVGSAPPTESQRVADAVVTVKGGTAFDADGALVEAANRELAASTNAQGCFAVVRYATSAPSATTLCTTPVNGASRAVTNDPAFVTTKMPRVRVSASSWQAFDETGYYLQSQSQVTSLVLLPAPVPVTNTVTVAGADGPVTDPIDVTVTPVAGRTIRASLVYDADAATPGTYELQWDDQSPLGTGTPTSLDSPQETDDVPTGSAVPGTYTLSFTSDDIVADTATLNCVRGGACTLSDPNLKERGSVTVTVRDGTLVGGVPADTPVNNALVTLTYGTSTEQARTRTDGTRTFSRLPPGAQAGFNIKAPGFDFGDAAASGTVQMGCAVEPLTGQPGTGYVLPLVGNKVPVVEGRQVGCTIRLKRLGTISGTLIGVRAEPGGPSVLSTILGNRTVTASKCTTPACTSTTGTPLSTTTNATTGGFVFEGTTEEAEGPEAGHYLLAVPDLPAAFDYGTFEQSNRVVEVFDVGDGASATPTLTLFAKKVPVAITLTDQFGQPVKGSAASVTLARNELTTSATDKVLTDGDNDGSYTVIGGVLPGAWFIKVDGTTIHPVVQGASLDVPESIGNGTPTVTKNVDVSRDRATVGGVVTEVARPGVATAHPVAQATVTLSPLGLTATTDDDGEYSIDEVPAGTYTVTVTKNGFTSTPITGVSVADGDVETVDPTMTALAVKTVVTLTAGEGESLTGFTATLTPRPGTWEATQPIALSGTKTGSATLTQLRFGCYDATLALPATGHYGRLQSVTTTPTTSGPDCSGGIWIPPTLPGGATEIIVAYAVDSAPLSWTYSAAAQPGHPVPVAATSTLRVTGGGLDVSPLLSPGGTVFVPAGSYTCAPQLDGVLREWWTGAPQSCATGGAALALALAERTATMTISAPGLTAGQTASVEITSAEPGASTTPVFADTVGPAGASVPLPYGDWLVEAVLPDGAYSDVIEIDDPDQTYPVVLVAAGP